MLGLAWHGVAAQRAAIATSSASAPASVASTEAASAAPATAGYTTIRPSRDGIGKVYMGREIAGVMGYQGAPWLERAEREREEGTSILIKGLDLRPGEIVADIGAGTGYLSRRMAKEIQPFGKVLAVDVQPEMVRMLTDTVRGTGLAIEPSLGAVDDVKLPADTVDLAIMVDVYHELSFPREVLASIVKSLKPDGEVVFVEYRAEDPKVPIKSLHKMSEAQVRLEAQQLPLVWEKTTEDLPWQHVIWFRKQP